VLLSDERVLAAAWREWVGHLVNVFLVPIFFTYTGLRTTPALKRVLKVRSVPELEQGQIA